MSSAEASRDVLFPVHSPHISLNADEEIKLLGVLSWKNNERCGQGALERR